MYINQTANMSSLAFGSPSALRILVYESTDILWFGIQEMLRDTAIPETVTMRLHHPNDLENVLSMHAVDILLLTSADSEPGLFTLLQKLASVSSNYPQMKVVVCLQRNIPYLARLLQGFGVSVVLTPDAGSPGWVEMFNLIQAGDAEDAPIRLSRQERYVAQALLEGKSVTKIAQITGRNVRTISAQKQTLVYKLNMKYSSELQTLGGRLMRAKTA